MAIEQMSKVEELRHDRMVKVGAEWHRCGLERPTFAHGSVAKVMPGVAPAQQRDSFRCCARMRRRIPDKQVKEEGESDRNRPSPSRRIRKVSVGAVRCVLRDHRSLEAIVPQR